MEEKTEKKKGVGGNGNLIPASMRSPQERAEIGRKGGLAFAENQKRRKTMQECMRALLDISVSKDRARESLGNMAEFVSDNPTIMEILNLVQVREAQEGNTKAFEVVRDTAGFKPTERQEITAEIMTESDRSLLELVAKRQGLTEKQPKTPQ